MEVLAWADIARIQIIIGGNPEGEFFDRNLLDSIGSAPHQLPCTLYFGGRGAPGLGTPGGGLHRIAAPVFFSQIHPRSSETCLIQLNLEK